MNATILYHSVSGNTQKMAELIAATMNENDRIDARAFSIDSIDEEFAKSSQCVIIGTPIYAAGATAAIHSYLQVSMKDLDVAGKLGGAFATANYVHGGGELGIRSILDAMMVRGMMVYSGGAAYGVPVIHLGPVGLAKDLASTEPFFVEYARRFASHALSLFV